MSSCVSHLSLVYAWRSILGKPDGTLVRLRCRLLGHRWLKCVDECCEGRMLWCERCLTCIEDPWISLGKVEVIV